MAVPPPKSARHPKAVSWSPQPPEGHGESPGAFYGLVHWNPGHWEQKQEDYERQNTKFLFFTDLNLGRNGIFEGTVFKPSCLLLAGRKDGGGAPRGGLHSWGCPARAPSVLTPPHQPWPRCHEPHLQVRPKGRHPEILKGSLGLGPAVGVRDRRQTEDQGPHPHPGWAHTGRTASSSPLPDKPEMCSI